jgi:hypothetical protein
MILGFIKIYNKVNASYFIKLKKKKPKTKLQRTFSILSALIKLVLPANRY